MASSSPEPPRWLDCAVGLTTLPTLGLLVVGQYLDQWANALNPSVTGWWVGHRLPVLDPATLAARQAQTQSTQAQTQSTQAQTQSTQAHTEEAKVAPSDPKNASASVSLE